jgi:hypothetical protein
MRLERMPDLLGVAITGLVDRHGQSLLL